MDRTSDSNSFLAAVDAAIEQIDAIDNTDLTTVEDQLNNQSYRATHEALMEFVDKSPAPEDSDLERVIFSVESLLQQIVRYGTPALGPRDPVETLRQFRVMYLAYDAGDASLGALEELVDAVRGDVLEHRPDTDVIGEHGLESDFDEAVRSISADVQHS